jgi:hypothetical protein
LSPVIRAPSLKGRQFMNQSGNVIGFLRTTAIGGLLFLLPLIVLGALIGQVVPIVMTVAETLGGILPVRTPGGIALLVLLAIAILLPLCFGTAVASCEQLGRGTMSLLNGSDEPTT